MLTEFRRVALDIVRPVSQCIGQIYAPFSHKLITGKDFRHVMKVLKPGDAIVTRTRGEMANLFIPGFYSHLGMYVGKDVIIEAVGRGVVETDIVEFIMKKDNFCILRPLFATKEQSAVAVEEAKKLVGLPYDYAFHPANNAFYCSELIYYSYKKAVEAMPFTLRKTLGVETVTPSDIKNATKHFEAIFER